MASEKRALAKKPDSSKKKPDISKFKESTDPKKENRSLKARLGIADKTILTLRQQLAQASDFEKLYYQKVAKIGELNEIVSKLTNVVLGSGAGFVSEHNAIARELDSLRSEIKQKAQQLAMQESLVKQAEKQDKDLKATIGTEREKTRKAYSSISQLRTRVIALMDEIAFDISGHFWKVLERDRVRATLARNEDLRKWQPSTASQDGARK
jgi:predicted  nucleic acid-binding Zn-ribbon protein